MPRTLLPLLMISLVAAGCAGSRPPGVTLVDARVVDTSAEALTIDCELELTNPNLDALELIEFQYGLSIDGRSAYSGKWSAEATLSANDLKRLTIPAVVRFDDMGWTSRPAAFGYRLNGSLLYVAPGRLAETLLDTGFRRPSVAFSDTGRIE